MPHEISRPFRFIQSLVEDRNKRGKTLWWFVFQFFLSPRIPFDYWRFCIDYESTRAEPEKLREKLGFGKWLSLNTWLTPLLLIICWYLFGGVVKAQFISGSGEWIEWLGITGGAIWISLSVVVNLLFISMIEFFSMPYKEVSDELEDSLKRRIDNLESGLKKDIHRVSEEIMGHKLWARKETHQLFSGLSADESGTRAKWFIVNFFSHLANDRITINTTLTGQVYEISTGKNDWPLSLYSKFLATNMDHAETEILWLVDPDDFFGILLPEFVGYVLAAQTVAFFKKTPDIDLDVDPADPPSARSVFSVYEAPPETSGLDKTAWTSLYQEVISGIKADIFLAASNPNHAEETWITFHEAVLFPTMRFGAAIIGQLGLLAKEEIVAGFKDWTQRYLDGLLPHLMAFRNVDSSVFRKRVIFLGCDMPREPESRGRWVMDRVSQLWDQNTAGWAKIPKEVTSAKIVDTALDLFIYTCGGEETLSVQGSLHSAPHERAEGEHVGSVAWDVGWYDRQFVVSAEETSESPPRREVEWYYGSSPKDALKPGVQDKWHSMLPSRICEALVLLDAARNGGGVSFSVFRKCLIGHLESLENAE